MGMRKMLARSAVLDDLIEEFEEIMPDVEAAFEEFVRIVPPRSETQNYDFNYLASTVQEMLVRQMLRAVKIPNRELEWDVIQEGRANRFEFFYKKDGSVLVKKRVKAKHADYYSNRDVSEIDFHGIVDGLPIIGEVKSGVYGGTGGTGKHALQAGRVDKKVSAAYDYFHRKIAYVAVLPSEQVNGSRRSFNSPHGRERFLGRGGYIAAFPYERRQWHFLMLDLANELDIPIDHNTIPGFMRQSMSWGTQRRIPKPERRIPTLQQKFA